MKLFIMKVLTIIVLFVIGIIALSQLHFVNKLNNVKTTSFKENKNIVIVFSESDLCVPCKQLEKEILNRPDFKNLEVDKLMILKADLTNKKVKNNTRQIYNRLLFEKYNPKGIFPLVVLLDKSGQKIAEKNYREINSRYRLTYINNLITLNKLKR